MAKNYEGRGDVWNHVAASAISSGDIVVMGDRIGVALTDIANGETGAVQIVGEFTLPKATGGALAQGDKVDYDVSAGNLAKGITPATGDVTDCAEVTEAAVSAATTVKVRLISGGSIN